MHKRSENGAKSGFWFRCRTQFRQAARNLARTGDVIIAPTPRQEQALDAKWQGVPYKEVINRQLSTTGVTFVFVSKITREPLKAGERETRIARRPSITAGEASRALALFAGAAAILTVAIGAAAHSLLAPQRFVEPLRPGMAQPESATTSQLRR